MVKREFLKNHKQVKFREFAETPEEIEAMIADAVKALDEKGTPNYPDPMLPPWVQFPDYGMTSMKWRMGPGEDYRSDFFEWFVSLTKSNQEIYINSNPEPEDWQGYYQIIIERALQREGNTSQ
ncbi:hypothetical protein [Kordiimonas sp. SCSIO 12610]|uniref:hypothetical protein n=1 Tax=Kordiimonas sp. SCSIO 12610 TaxID=2829597 RepID=UPI00210D0EB8|nr:hypothetical protein [Kordiimonas sp. SCSIO 12610]UTW56652.1 hypothetical protein KFF44_07105 [Kordiimonas sp. SCSIO 12610]